MPNRFWHRATTSDVHRMFRRFGRPKDVRKSPQKLINHLPKAVVLYRSFPINIGYHKRVVVAVCYLKTRTFL